VVQDEVGLMIRENGMLHSGDEQKVMQRIKAIENKIFNKPQLKYLVERRNISDNNPFSPKFQELPVAKDQNKIEYMGVKLTPQNYQTSTKPEKPQSYTPQAIK
jgi:hypothetical protein